MNCYQYYQEKAAALNVIDKAFIDGQFVSSISKQTFACINPATQEVLAEVVSCDHHDADLAVASARKAYQSGVWSRLAPVERKTILLKLADLIEENAEEFALLDTLDMGKPIADSSGFDVPTTIACLRWSAEAADKVYGEIAPTAPSALALITREPIGVVSAIVPWNYPLMMACWKIAPALAAGNSVILKPSEKSPLSALLLAKLSKEAGVPDGVFNVLPGFGHSVGKALALHMDVDVIAFTGSTHTAGLLMKYAGESNLKRVWLEAGGKSPCIVYEDCEDLEKAAAAVAMGIFSNQGEVCIATSRLLVQASIKEQFLALVIEQAKTYIPADPLDPNTNMGPVVDEQHLHSIRAHIMKAQQQGANLVLGTPQVPLNTGCYINPIIFTVTNNNLAIVQEEVFGPVLAVSSFGDIDEAMELANDCKYGLAAGIWTNDLNKAHKTARELQAGMVWINNWGGGDASTPFGGIKQSGNGRDKSLHSVEKYTELKTTWIDFGE